MSEKILFVDDDTNILAAYHRQLRKQFTVDTAAGGELGLEMIKTHGPYAVIVADMRMPGMNGVQFLSKVKEDAPNSVRMMLTGNTDQQTAIDAVNEGNIFRFLNKPCPPEIMVKVLNAGIEQYRLITAEKELLEKTLSGIVKVLTDVLTLVNPTAFGRASRIRRIVRKMAVSLLVDKMWQMEVAVMLSQVGYVTIPKEVLRKLYNGINLSEKEFHIFESYPQIGYELIAKIPRLETIAKIIAYQEKHFDGSGLPQDTLRGEEIPLESRIIKLAFDFESFISSGFSENDALDLIRMRDGWYDPSLIQLLGKIISHETGNTTRTVRVDELTPSMILDEDINDAASGEVIVSKGYEASQSMCMHLRNMAIIEKIKDRVKVVIPVE